MKECHVHKEKSFINFINPNQIWILILFGAKSIRNVLLESEFGLDSQDSEKNSTQLACQWRGFDPQQLLEIKTSQALAPLIR